MMTKDDKEKFLRLANENRKELFTIGDIHEGSPPGHLCAVLIYTKDGTVHHGTYNLVYGYRVKEYTNGEFSHYTEITDIIAYIKN